MLVRYTVSDFLSAKGSFSSIDIFGHLYRFTLIMLNSLCTTLLPNFQPVNLHLSSCKRVFSIRMENSVDPDQMALSEAEGSYSGSTLFSEKDKFGFSRTRDIILS